MLGNVRYSGMVCLKEGWYDNIFPRIVGNAVQAIRDRNKHNSTPLKESMGYILSGKLVCGNCKSKMVDVSGTGKLHNVYQYHICKTRKKGKDKCEIGSIPKKRIEDIVIDHTMMVLRNEGLILQIAQELYKMHQKETEDNTALKALTKKKTQAEKACANLISALEQGFITEQTKGRLKELEVEIAQLEVDIEKEKNRTRAYLTVDMIADFLQSLAYHDASNQDVRKVIVNTLIRQIVIEKERIIISYNFVPERKKHEPTRKDTDILINKTNNPHPIINNPDDTNFFDRCSYTETVSPPPKN